MTDATVLIAVLVCLVSAGPSLCAAGPSAPPRPVVVIVTTSAVDAFGEALEGIRRGLGSGAKILVVDLTQQPAERTQLGGKDVALLVTVGTRALEAAAQSASAPIIATMVLRADLPAAARRSPAASVVLDLGLTEILAGLAKVFPGKTRAGLIRDPATWETSAPVLEVQARAAGMTLKVAECSRPERLLNAFLSLRDLVDFVWCPPDANLFNGTTVKPLILASLEHRLPVGGFSSSFVRAGASAGVYPDYLEVGLQAGELARKYLTGSSVEPVVSPRKLRVAANMRVARLLGLRIAEKGASDSGIAVIE